MKTRLTRVAAVFLALIMLVALAACNSGSSASSSAAPASSGAASSGAAPAAPSEDEGPLEISFVSPNWEDAPDFNNEWYTRFFEETNTHWDITFVPSSDYPTKYDLILASGDLPDIIMSEASNRPSTVQAVQNGLFWNLSPYLGDFSNYPNLRDNPSPNLFKFCSYEGNIYAIPRSRPQLDENLCIRQDWLAMLGLDMPTTLDEFKDVMKKIVDGDPDGNGLDDTIGLIGWTFHIGDAHKSFFNAFGCYNVTPNAEGGLDYPEIKDEMADLTEYWHELYDLGILSQEFGVMTTTQAEDLITSGHAACYGYNIWRCYDYSERTKVVQPDCNFVIIPPMQGPKDDTAVLEKGGYGFFHIAKSKVDEAKLLRILDYFELTCSEYWLDKGYYGWEGIHYNIDENGTKIMTDVGKTEIGTGIQQPLPMMANTWANTVCATAPKAYNDAQLEACQVIVDKGNTMIYDTLTSATWTDTWPQYQSEYEAKFVQAIVGQISNDEFRSYLADLRAKPEFQQAAQEYRKDYENIYGPIS